MYADVRLRVLLSMHDHSMLNFEPIGQANISGMRDYVVLSDPFSRYIHISIYYNSLVAECNTAFMNFSKIAFFALFLYSLIPEIYIYIITSFISLFG
jgi:hypothetical protein